VVLLLGRHRPGGRHHPPGGTAALRGCVVTVDPKDEEQDRQEPIPTDMGEELICLECEFEAESIEHLAEHMRETPGH
jgi:hypothetical protein